MSNEKYTYFVLLQSPTGKMKAGYGFRSYTDESGNSVTYNEGKRDSNGNKVGTKFTFSRRHRTMPVHNKASGLDSNGERILKVDFLRNSPFCKGSPNGEGVVPIFKEMNTDKDIDIALEAGEIRRKAEGLAANLKGEDLKNASALFGKVDGTVKAQKFKVMQAAFHDPEEFLKVVENDQFKMRGFIQRGLLGGKLTREGFIIKFNGTTIGIDEDEAIHALLKDVDLYNSIKKVIGNKK